MLKLKKVITLSKLLKKNLPSNLIVSYSFKYKLYEAEQIEENKINPKLNRTYIIVAKQG